MNLVSLILALVAGCSFLASAIQGLVAWHSTDPQLQKRLRPSIIVSSLLAIALVGASYYSATLPQTTTATSTPQSSPTTTSTSVALRPTSSPTATLSSPSPTPSPTATPAPTSDYSAAQPGPGCDTNRGTWTPQGISGVTCGTWVNTSPQYSWGYLFFQLPNNTSFAANNEISVTISNIDSLNSSCIGLAEIGSTTGYMASYCQNNANPNWTIYSVSNQGTIIQSLSTNATSNRTNTTLLLSMVNNTLKFAIDTESHQISIASFQPTKVAIAFYNNGCGNCTAKTSNFNYITPAN